MLCVYLLLLLFLGVALHEVLVAWRAGRRQIMITITQILIININNTTTTTTNNNNTNNTNNDTTNYNDINDTL